MTTIEVKAHVKPESLTTRFSSVGTVTGIIYFSAGNVTFPEDVWEDNPIIIVGWWLTNLAEYASGSDGCTVELSFMDGPFYLLLSLGGWDSDAGTWRPMRAEMIGGQAGSDQVLHSAMVDLRDLYQSIDEVGGVLIEFCERQPTGVSDCTQLVEARERARDAFSHLIKGTKGD
jgi:hypothetical protein